jgi:hypothetical protein
VALQIVPSGNPQQKSAVVVPIPYPAAAVIRQEDLEEFILLRRLAREAEDNLAAKEDELRLKLDAGAVVEAGIHTARLKVSVVVE